MFKNRAFSIFAVAALVGAAACSPGEETIVDDETTVTDTSMFTETQTEMVPVVAPVTTTDTGLVETTVEVERDVNVDTVRRP
jgi:predicted S18 family serine protease